MTLTDQQRVEIKTISKRWLKNNYAYDVWFMMDEPLPYSELMKMYTAKQLKAMFYELTETRFNRIKNFPPYKHMIK